MNTKKLLIYFIIYAINCTTIFAADKTIYIDWRGDNQSFSFTPTETTDAYTNQLYGCNALLIAKKEAPKTIRAHMSHYRSDSAEIQAHAALNFTRLNNIDPNDPSTAVILFRMKNNDPLADQLAKRRYIGTPEETEHAHELACMNAKRDIQNNNVLNFIKGYLNLARDPKIVEYPKITEMEAFGLGDNRSVHVKLNPDNILTYKIQHGKETPVFREDVLQFIQSQKLTKK
ncbi:MAG: hypothetical protein ACXWL2_01140 [Candidatus Chromulinivorax sp.]